MKVYVVLKTFDFGDGADSFGRIEAVCASEELAERCAANLTAIKGAGSHFTFTVQAHEVAE